jgi:hypothetical protein
VSSLSVFSVAVRIFYSVIEVSGRSSCRRVIPSLLSRWDLRQWTENNWSIDTGLNHEESYCTEPYKSERALITFDGSFNGKTRCLDWSNFPSGLGVHNVMVPRLRQGSIFGRCIFLDEPHVQYAWIHPRWLTHLLTVICYSPLFPIHISAQEMHSVRMERASSHCIGATGINHSIVLSS